MDNRYINKLIIKSNQMNELTTKRFVIRKSLIGKNVVITFTNKKGDVCTYDHDEVYNNNKERFDNMKCFQKYKSYTCTNNLPTFGRSIETDDSPDVEKVFTLEQDISGCQTDQQKCDNWLLLSFS